MEWVGRRNEGQINGGNKQYTSDQHEHCLCKKIIKKIEERERERQRGKTSGKREGNICFLCLGACSRDMEVMTYSTSKIGSNNPDYYEEENGNNKRIIVTTFCLSLHLKGEVCGRKMRQRPWRR